MTKSTFTRVAEWNIICGKSAPTIGTMDYYTALSNQAARIKEELQELEDAITLSRAITEAMAEPDYDVNDIISFGGEVIEVNQKSLDHWNQEILDAGCDLDVVVAGTNFISGHDYQGAINSVLDNNDVKYTHILDDASAALAHLGEEDHNIVATKVLIDFDDENLSITDGIENLIEHGYTAQEIDGNAVVYQYSVHRNSDDKICKLLNHPKVDLSPFMASGEE